MRKTNKLWNIVTNRRDVKSWTSIFWGLSNKQEVAWICKKFMSSKIPSESVASICSGEQASLTIHLSGRLVLFNYRRNISDKLRSKEISDDPDHVWFAWIGFLTFPESYWMHLDYQFSLRGSSLGDGIKGMAYHARSCELVSSMLQEWRSQWPKEKNFCVTILIITYVFKRKNAIQHSVDEKEAGNWVV